MTWAGAATLISGDHRIDLVELRRFHLVSQVMIVLNCRRIAICGGDTADEAFRKARVAAEMTLLGMAERKGMKNDRQN